MLRHRRSHAQERAAAVSPANQKLRRPALEALESRTLLAVTATEYATIRSTYADFALPADMAQVNIIEITPAQLSVANLKSAITRAGSTTLPDLVVARTTDAQNTITYASSADELKIDIPVAQGAISVVGFGSRPLTLDASRQCEVITVGFGGGKTTVNLGGLTLTKGAVTGGGISQTAGTLRLENAAVIGNMATCGAGIRTRFCTSILTNVTISGNVASWFGGGIYLMAGTSTLTNVTISGNTAPSGGGVYLGITTLNNTIVAGNVADSYPDIYGGGAGSNNLIGDGTGTAWVNGVDGNLVGTTANPIDPMLAEGVSAGIGLSPLPGSPAIDAGDNSLIPSGVTTDIYGAARIQGATVNIGAVETVLPPKAPVRYVVTSLADGTAADGVVTLREALAAANSNQAAGDAPAGSYSSADLIEFSAGLAGAILTHGQAYAISSNLALVGPGADQLTLDAGGSGGVLDVSGMYDVSVSALTVTGGNAVNGGGVFAAGAFLLLDHLVISGNTTLFLSGIYDGVGSGGGVYLCGGTSMLRDVMISGNTASCGGGMYQFYGTSALTNVTISGNTAGEVGGVYQYSSTSALTLNNTIVARNAAVSSPDLYMFSTLLGANNLIGDGTGPTALVNGVNGNLVGTTASPIDPKFVSMVGTDWTQWNLRLQASSPAVNKGDNASVPAGVTTDIAGAPRIQGGTIDMGAYEFDSTPPTLAGVMVNDGSAQRSMVNKIVVTFSEPVTLAAGALSVLRSPGHTECDGDSTESQRRSDELGTDLHRVGRHRRVAARWAV